MSGSHFDSFRCIFIIFFDKFIKHDGTFFQVVLCSLQFLLLCLNIKSSDLLSQACMHIPQLHGSYRQTHFNVHKDLKAYIHFMCVLVAFSVRRHN